MSNQLLEIKGLSVHVEDKEILHGIDLEIKKGETHVLMGPNGAGKSTLGYALMGNPRYEVTAGAIRFQGKEITREAPDKRAREGMFHGTAQGSQGTALGLPKRAGKGHGAAADGPGLW